MPRERSPPDDEPSIPEAAAAPAQRSGRRRPTAVQPSNNDAVVCGRQTQRRALPAVSYRATPHCIMGLTQRPCQQALVDTLTSLRLSLKRFKLHAKRGPH